MKSTASIGGHPIHPMLIPFPFAYLTGATAFDVLAATRQNQQFANTARHLAWAGLASAAVAAIPGLIDYATTVPEGKPRRTATSHLVANLSALACFAAAAQARSDDLPNSRVLTCGLLGTALLGIGGWFGGSLSYHHQIGVDPEEERRSRRRELTQPDRRPSLEEAATIA
jgi:uncharacterized membrane protein